MLTLTGSKGHFCDGISRRSFLQVGGLAAGGLTLPQLLQAEQKNDKPGHKAVIMVYLSGGISHQDTVDLKPEAPAEVRGEFHPIETSVPGIFFGELLPKLQRSDEALFLAARHAAAAPAAPPASPPRRRHRHRCPSALR